MILYQEDFTWISESILNQNPKLVDYGKLLDQPQEAIMEFYNFYWCINFPCRYTMSIQCRSTQTGT